MSKLNKLLRLGEPFTEFNLTVLGWTLILIPTAMALMATALIVSGY